MCKNNSQNKNEMKMKWKWNSQTLQAHNIFSYLCVVWNLNYVP